MDPTKKLKTGNTVSEGYVQQSLAPLQDNQLDKEELIEEYKLLIQYKVNQTKLATLIQLEKDQDTLEELNAMNQELQEAVGTQEDKIKALQNNDIFTYSTQVLKEEDVGKLCKAFYESSNKWYHAQVMQLEQEEQLAQIQFIGYKEVVPLHSIFIKLMTKPNPESFSEGSECEAIYSEDGKYYPCQIIKIEGEHYTVKFKRYNTKEAVSIYHLRESKNTNAQNTNKKRQFEDLTEFKLPDNLKILPTDNEQQRLSKKKKTKALKQQFKQAQIEKESSDKQNKWSSFQCVNNKNGAIKKSIFQTSDRIGSKVGVMNSGQGMTNFSMRDRLILEDNSHLSRQF